MNTQTQTPAAPMMVRSINSGGTFKPSVDPYEIRWGFNGTQRYFQVNAQECGIAVVPFADWFEIVTFRTRKEMHTTDDTKPREQEIDIPAEDAQTALEREMAGKNNNISTLDLGLRVEFRGEFDAGKMKVLSRTLLPQLSEIREFCASIEQISPIGLRCPGQDNLDRTPREDCPSCWLVWLESDECAAFCEEKATSGVVIREIDEQTGKSELRTIYLEIADLETARNLMIDSIRTGLSAMEDTWGKISEELINKSRKKIQPDQNQLRKDLHQDRPEDREIVAGRQFAREIVHNQGLQQQQQQAAQQAAPVSAETIAQIVAATMMAMNQQQSVPPQTAAPKVVAKASANRPAAETSAT